MAQVYYFKLVKKMDSKNVATEELPEGLVNELFVEEKIQKVVKDPKLSLKQLAAYPLATEKGKTSILRKAKYPGGYVPRFYEEARKIICNTFSANSFDTEIYLEEFKRQADTLTEEARYLERDQRKNKICSSNALHEMKHLNAILEPIISSFVLNSNLKNTRDHLYIQEVKIGCMADMLVYENGGATLAGFLKFNFTKQALKKEEAQNMLYVMQRFFEKKEESVFKNRSCMLIDVFAHKLYKSERAETTSLAVKQSCTEINEKWNLITQINS